MAKAKFDTERKVYEEVMKKAPLAGNLIKDVVERDGRNLYLVGEDHHEGDAVRCVHTEIIPVIESDSPNWMMLREGHGAYNDYSDEELIRSHPTYLYFRKLPTFLDIPVDDAVGNITSKKTQDKIVSGSDVTLDEIRGWYITNFIEVNRGRMNPEELRESCCARLGIGMGDLDRASEFAYSREVHEKLMTNWNRIARGELDRILGESPSKTNVLVSVGVAHLPAFSDRYTYIG